MAVKLNRRGFTFAKTLIDRGDVNSDDSWSFSADDGNELLGDPPSWDRYLKHFLGRDSDADEETKEAWKYPFAKKDGDTTKIYRSAVRAIRSRAAQNNHDDVFKAAGTLMEMLDEMEDSMKGTIEIVGRPDDVERYKKERGVGSDGIDPQTGRHVVYGGLKKFGQDGGKSALGQYNPNMLHPEYRQTTMTITKVMDESGKELGQPGFDEESKLRIEGIANANIVDRVDERMDPRGIDIQNFMLNPILLADHFYMTGFAVGEVEELRTEDDGVHFVAYIGDPTKAPLTQLQRDVRSLVAQGILKTVSVGFIPTKIQAPVYDDEGRIVEPAVVLAWELLELSIVAVPANPLSTFEIRQVLLNTSITNDVQGLTNDADGANNKDNNNQNNPNDEDAMDEKTAQDLVKSVKELVTVTQDNTVKLQRSVELQESVLGKLDAKTADDDPKPEGEGDASADPKPEESDGDSEATPEGDAATEPEGDDAGADAGDGKALAELTDQVKAHGEELKKISKVVEHIYNQING